MNVPGGDRRTTQMGRWLRRLIAWLGLVIGASPAAWAERVTVTLPHDGRARDFVVDGPAGGAAMPLVVVLHGAGGTGEQALDDYHWSAAAYREHFIVVAPNALPSRPDQPARFLSNPAYWNDGSNRGPAPHLGIDDVGFIAAVIDEMIRRGGIDPHRVYVTGFSSGASMTQRVGTRLAGKVAAIASVAGQLWVKEPPARPLPVMLVMGDKDPLHPWNGGRPWTPWGRSVPLPPVTATADGWATLLRCRGPQAVTHPGPSLTRATWQGCPDGAALVFITVAGLGHRWPGGEPGHLPERLIGPGSTALDTTAEIWAFFRERTR